LLQTEGASAFAARVAKVLEHTEFRRADTIADKEAIYRMRYEAYAREGYIDLHHSGLFSDPDDERPNAWLIGVFIDGDLAASIRLHVASRPRHHLPAMAHFSDVVLPHLESGDLIIDASRMTSRFEYTRLFPFMPYITMRTAFLAEEHFDADYITAACREEYQGAYRRMYGAANWAAPRPYPPMTRPQALMAYDCKALFRATRARYPFENSTAEERRALYSRSSNLAENPHAELTSGHALKGSGPMQHSTTSAAYASRPGASNVVALA
jgi:hypothetical protein